MDPVIHCEQAGGVGTLTINRPPVNAVDPALIADLRAAVTACADDPAVRCLVIRGTGSCFVAGADLRVMRDLSLGTQRLMRGWVTVLELIEATPKPVIAALNGHALGGGAELALACDLRIAAEAATVGFPEVTLGLIPGAGGSVRLPRLVGPHLAKRLMMDGSRLTAREAERLGLVDLVVTPEEFEDTVRRTALDYATRATAAIGEIKRMVRASADGALAAASAAEFEAVLRLTATDDAAEGLQAFLDKRPAVFWGR
ncbi:enoyl-CoA hydratase/isomerase family protein [Raineyella sp. W15-4]|uniref:enoyl-CoA hydratase/isomerase family protein n=1 Tax=Raineyella sp. W15-4 TaxID=3081651 RepID=UPI002953DDFC|nr:enoyl-CoA hydratase-related protein [Raineyella sp. W15-4]WOQ17406.1 enoyl-CoA hydratase-related protein [Raineyella sp. W15-4]